MKSGTHASSETVWNALCWLKQEPQRTARAAARAYDIPWTTFRRALAITKPCVLELAAGATGGGR